ncbi:MAG: antibiotic biosynthesis monooxygenase [Ruminococcaceae bacterium]|nr:antibiotic biosynthesis monooxygenase [Oscillospiraceae bacterium]
MSITINIYYSGENGNAKKFAQEMLSRGIVEKIRAEEGNIKYEYFLPMNDEETVLLIDCWKDQLSLDKHHNSPVMQEIIELREKYDLHMQVERYISDVSENPDDEKFIRK